MLFLIPVGQLFVERKVQSLVRTRRIAWEEQFTCRLQTGQRGARRPSPAKESGDGRNHLLHHERPCARRIPSLYQVGVSVVSFSAGTPAVSVDPLIFFISPSQESCPPSPLVIWIPLPDTGGSFSQSYLQSSPSFPSPLFDVIWVSFFSLFSHILEMPKFI